MPARPLVPCRFRLALAVLVASWLALPTARAQDNRFVSGSVSVSAQSLLGWSETITGSVVLRLDGTDEGGGEHYVLDTASFSWRAFGTTPDGCTVSGQAQVEETEESAATVSIYPDASYNAMSVALELASDQSRVTITCPTYTVRLGPALAEFLHIPTAAETGGEPFRFEEMGAIRALDGTWGSGEVGDPRFTWSLTAAPPAPVELVVTPAGYAAWLPEGHLRQPEQPGTTLNITAELRGGNPTPAATRFRFELAGVSREPGVTMNWPLDAADLTDPDLRITSGTNVTSRDTEDGAWAETGPGTSAHVTLSAYDFGAFATLRVVATLVDGTEVVGRLDGTPGTTAIPLPRRMPDSFVATAWKASAGASAQADDADQDGAPVGDGFAGDGLTVYEEYRGFRENGTHLRTSPNRKDYFLSNALAGLTLPGIVLFEQLSGLAVHPELVIGEEFDPEVRVVNANHGAGPHRVDQHGVWLRQLSATGVGQAVGPTEYPGTPRVIDYVEISNYARFTGYEPGVGLTLPAALPGHIAHELLHTVAVYHHGDRDAPGGVVWEARRDPATGAVVRDADGYPELLEDGVPVTAFAESGSLAVPLLEQLALASARSVRVWVGEEHGQHGGHELCVMRYAVAQAYRRPGSSDRFWTGRERFGRQICTSGAGTGPNASSWLPRSRFGDADPAGGGRSERGDCAHQIRVSDAE